jgi:MscS family membrane protein
MKAFRLLSFTILCAIVPHLLADAPAGAETPAPASSTAPADNAGAADNAGSNASSTAARTADEARLTTAAAAAVASRSLAAPRAPDLLEHLVDVVLELFDVKSSGNTPTHYIIAALFMVGAFLLRRVVTTVIFGLLKRWAAKTETTLDDKLFPALEGPVAALISVVGTVAALKVLKLSETSDRAVGYASTVVFSLVFFWMLLRAFNAVLDHAHEVATEKQLGIAAFMPWIKKSLLVIFVVFGVLMIAQSLGADVKAFLAGLGIGGLAFALAAQDTIANVFGSVVVAIDQPFKLGEYVKVGSHEGTVEDIGLRSTRLRTPARTLITVPNKTMASESINNLSRMPQRRVDQSLGLTYATTPDKMEAVLGDLRALIEAEPGVAKDFVVVRFSSFGAYSLDIQVIYFTADPDFRKHMVLRERLNLGFMRAVEARGLSFAFPTQSLQFEGEIARQLVARYPGTPAGHKAD